MMLVRNIWGGLVLASVIATATVQGFYIPGVAPKEYADGDNIDVKAVKMTSTRQFLPFEYYSLPFCRPVTTPPTTSLFFNSRTLMGCTDPLRRGVGALHQCPLGSLGNYLIYADVRAFR